jgi:hypothetical protein
LIVFSQEQFQFILSPHLNHLNELEPIRGPLSPSQWEASGCIVCSSCCRDSITPALTSDGVQMSTSKAQAAILWNARVLGVSIKKLWVKFYGHESWKRP